MTRTVRTKKATGLENVPIRQLLGMEPTLADEIHALLDVMSK